MCSPGWISYRCEILSQHIRPLIIQDLGLHDNYLEGQGDLVSRLITPISHIVIPLIPSINLLTK